MAGTASSNPWGLGVFYVLIVIAWYILLFERKPRNQTLQHAATKSTRASTDNSVTPTVKPITASTNATAQLLDPIDYKALLLEWADREQQVVRFLWDEKTAAVVYRNDFEGSTLWPTFWDLVDGNAWETRTLQVIRYFLKGHGRAGVYIDFGAWIGPTVLYAARFVRYIYALEPDPLAFSALAANVHANTILASRIQLFRECIHTSNANVEMRGFGDSTSRAADGLTWEKGEGAPTWLIRCRTLPQFVSDLKIQSENIKLIKIDVEGAEGGLLPSLLPWIASFEAGKRPALWLSIHMPYWGGGDDSGVDGADGARTTVAPSSSSSSTSATADAHDQKQQQALNPKAAAVWRVFSLYRWVFTQDFAPVYLHNGTQLCDDFCTYLLTDEAFVPPHGDM